MYSENELESLLKKLNKHLENQDKNWTSFIFSKNKKFYQSFMELNIDGERSTENRIKQYKLNSYFSNEKNALDIGCNSGFFSLMISDDLKNIDGVEINPFLIDMGNEVKQFIKNTNCSFFVTSFEKYSSDKKYDLIFSLANDETIDGNTKFTFEEYIEKIFNLLLKNGILIFESQAADAYDKNKFKPKLEFLLKKFDVLEERIVTSEYPINVPNRIFMILKKKI
jgi:SAM-dependent methyltransferase